MSHLKAVCAAALLCSLTIQAVAQDDTNPTESVVTMDEAIERAVRAAPTLELHQERVAARRSTVIQAGFRPNPILNLDSSDITSAVPFSGLGQTELTLSMSQQIERGGKREARVEQAEAGLRLSQISNQVARSEVELQARLAYLDVSAAHLRLTNARNRSEVLKAFANVVEQQSRTAAASRATVGLVSAKYQEAQADVEQAQITIIRTSQFLTALWGADDGRVEVDLQALLAADSPYDYPATLVTDQSLDVREGRAEKARARAGLRLERARAKQDPSVRLGLRRIGGSGDMAAVASVSIPLAFFDTNKGNIQRAAAEERAAEWAIRDTQLHLKRRYANAFSEMDAAYRDIVNLREVIMPIAKTALHEAQKGYEQGGFSYLEVLGAQQALQDFEERELSSLVRYHQSEAILIRLMAADDAPSMGEE